MIAGRRDPSRPAHDGNVFPLLDEVLIDLAHFAFHQRYPLDPM